MTKATLKLSDKLTDLRFIIGVFLSLIGFMVLIAAWLSEAPAKDGVNVNLIGGGVLLLTGIAMLIGSLIYGLDQSAE